MPTYLKEMRGNPGKRKLNDAEPQFGICQPEDLAPPTDIFDDEATACWDRTTFLLSQAGILSHVSRDHLILYCQAWSDWMRCEREKEKLKGRMAAAVGNDERAEKMERYWRMTQAAATKTMHDFRTEYGMTPSSASRIKVTGATSPGSKLDKFCAAKPAGKPNDPSSATAATKRPD